MHDASAGPELAVELSFSSEWGLEAEPDKASWAEPELFDELEEEPACSELAIPAASLAVAAEAWNLGETRSPLRRAIAIAAAFVPLMLSAEPVFGAEPPQDNVPPPSESDPPALPSPEISVPPTSNVPPPTLVVPSQDEPAIWDALIDQHVVLTLTDHTTFRGMVLSASDGVLVCARAGDGLMVVIRVAEVATVHVEGLPRAPTPPRPQHGQGLIVFGSIATAIGGALAVATVAVAGDCASSEYSYSTLCPYYTLPLGIVGAVNLAVGIPLLATGVRKRNAMREAEQPQVSAFVTPGREGVMGGVGLRF